MEQGEEVRWIGFRATAGGGPLDVELFVEVERRRSLCCGGGKTGLLVEDWTSFRDVWNKPLLSEVNDGSKGGGSLREPFVVDEVDGRGFGGGGVNGVLT